MGKPKELKMPKGKILMGKSSPKRGKNMSQPKRGSGGYKAKTQDIVFPAKPSNENVRGFVASSKKGNTVKSTAYVGKKGNWDLFRVTDKETRLGAGGRRENTLTTKYIQTPDRQPIGNGEFEIYGNKRNNVVVTEVQHNRGSGTRKTGAKKKGY